MPTDDCATACAAEFKDGEVTAAAAYALSHVKISTTFCVAEANQVELPSDAGWSTWAELPDNGTNQDVLRNQPAKYVNT